MLETALKYAKAGGAVFPCHYIKEGKCSCGTNCPKPGKHPMTRNGCLDATKDETQIRKWWTDKPDANIALATGAPSGITVVDVEEGGDTSIFPTTDLIKTGGNGWHFYYNYEPGVKNAVKILPLVDIRGEGGYVLAPPSNHISGNKYEVIKIVGRNKFPSHLFSGIKREKVNLKDILVSMPQGNRNDTAARLIGKFLREFSPSEWENSVWPLIKGWNEKNQPPMSEYELRNVFRSIANKEIVNRKGEIGGEKILLDESKITFTDVLRMGREELQKTKSEDVISFGYKWLDNKMTGLFPGELVVMGGETGCLHPDTPIYDPIDKTTLSVKERAEIGKEFNVYSLNGNKVIVSKALPPKKFIKTKMYELSDGKNKIVVTGKHRVWDGERYTTVYDLSKFSSFLLPTISDTSLSVLPVNVQHCSKIIEDSQSDYLPSDRSNDEQLHPEINDDQDSAPSQADVHEIDQTSFDKDAKNTEPKHNHPYQFAAPHSTLDSLNQKNNNSSNESNNHSTKDTSSLTSQTPSSLGKSYASTPPAGVAIHTGQSSSCPKVDNTSQDLLFFSYAHYTKWVVKEQSPEYYYDFTVPKYENYFAGGLFHHNSGKSTFAMNIVHKASKKNNGTKCYVFALEDRLVDYGIKSTYFEIGRLRGAEERLTNYEWNEYRKNEIKDSKYSYYFDKAQKNLENSNIEFYEAELFEDQIDIKLLEKIIDKKVKEGVKLFLIDHLHYFDLLSGKDKKSDFIEAMMVKLKTILNKTGARAILIVHYKKLEGKKPLIDSFKDSVSIPQNANYVVNLWRDRSPGGDRFNTFLYCPKSRNPNGEFTLELTFNPDENDYELKGDTFGTFGATGVNDKEKDDVNF